MIDPDFLDELDRFDAAVADRARSRRRGERDSPAIGEGRTFSDYRRYSPGDEPRLVDWKLYARTEELYVKQFEAERQATIHVLVDASRSMDFGEGDQHKFEFAARIGLGFAYLTAREHDEFRFSLFQGSVDRLDRGRSSRGEVLHLVDRCNAVEPTGEAAFADTLEAYAETIRSKALVVVVSDFLADPAAIGTGLGALADTDTIAVRVLAPDERDPPATGDTVVEGSEDETSLRTYFGRRLRDRYRDRLDAHVDDVASACHDLGARHELVDTGAPFFETFADCWFGDRSARGRSP